MRPSQITDEHKRSHTNATAITTAHEDTILWTNTVLHVVVVLFRALTLLAGWREGTRGSVKYQSHLYLKVLYQNKKKKEEETRKY